MDGTTFDQLIKSMATTRLTRLQTLRGLAVGAVAVTIGFAAPDEADAKCKKKCDQCQKKVKKKTKSGHVRCKCRAKANGTQCSIPGATTATTCLNGACVAAAGPGPGPSPLPLPLPPPGFNCNISGCVGANAGLVCNTSTGACVNCTSFTECPRVPVQIATIQQACIGGICRGGEACQTNPECFGVLECLAPNFNTSGTTFCLFKTECSTDTSCPTTGQVCVDSICTVTCAFGGNCTGQCGTGVTCTCQAGACLPA